MRRDAGGARNVAYTFGRNLLPHRDGRWTNAERIRCEIEPSLQEFGSLLFRDKDAAGVFWAAGPASAAETCRRLRLAEVGNTLFVVLDALDDPSRAATARAMALNAGADDAQHWPVDSAEIIACLRALHRRERLGDSEKIATAGAFLYPGRSAVEGPDGSVHLSGQECALLEVITSRPGNRINGSFQDLSETL